MSPTMNDAGILIHGLFMSVVSTPLKMPSVNGIPIRQGPRLWVLGGVRLLKLLKFSIKMSYVGSCGVGSQQCP